MTDYNYIKLTTMKQNKYLQEKYGIQPIDLTPYLPKLMQ